MSRIQSGDRVKIHYRASFTDGGEFDSTAGLDPLEFIVGQGQVLPGLEKAVLGMTVGSSKTETFPPQLAFGLHRGDLVQIANRADLPKALKIEIGLKIHAAAQDGQPPVLATVIDFTDQTVTLDANHPLAGKNLRYEIQVMDVIPSTASLSSITPIFTPAPSPMVEAPNVRSPLEGDKKPSAVGFGFADARIPSGG